MAELHRAALVYLRASRRWAQKELAAAAGTSRQQISSYESGQRRLTRKRLSALAGWMGYGEEEIDLTMGLAEVMAADPADRRSAGTDGATTEEREGGPGPRAFEPSDEERLALRRAALRLGLDDAAAASRKMLQLARQKVIEAAVVEAAAAWQRLAGLKPEERCTTLEAEPEHWSWALAERLCRESEAEAANDPAAALTLAELATWVVDKAPGLGTWRRRLRGYCLAYVANAERVCGNLLAADALFVEAWTGWRGAEPPALEPLAEWRLHDLEASLRRDRSQFDGALACLVRALASVPDSERARVLLKKQSTLEYAGDIPGSLGALEEALASVTSSADARLHFALATNRAVLLCYLGRHQDAQSRLAELLALARGLGNKMDLVRVLWLSGRIAAAQGRRGDARADFERVRDFFVAHRIGNDAALVSLELAIVYLEEGLSAEVARLAEDMLSLFGALRLSREMMASLKLFCDAARDGVATSALARCVMQYLETKRGNAPSSLGRA